MLNPILDSGDRGMDPQFVQASFCGFDEALLLFRCEEVTHYQREAVP